ncbi:unnamed protein product [Caenorhabditis sp. 36 PRJEB53466]|nr:unnamed protein product [Caenorhabditis sp. 36 PRJEB53466]
MQFVFISAISAMHAVPRVLGPEEPWRPMYYTDAEKVAAVRRTGFYIFVMWQAIIGTWMIYDGVYRPVGDCEMYRSDAPMNIEAINFHAGWTKDKQLFKYALVEYILHEKSAERMYRDQTKSEYDEIPILFIPGAGDSVDSQQVLARLVHEQTRGMPFRYRWFAVDFNRREPHESGDILTTEHRFVVRANEILSKMYPRKKTVLIGHTYGGIIGLASMSVYDWTSPLPESINVTNMLIAQSSGFQAWYYVDERIYRFYRGLDAHWNRKVETGDYGVAAYGVGMKSDVFHPAGNYKKGMTQVPMWTLDKISDCGVNEKEVFQCVSLLDQNKDLLIEYGLNYEHKSGKEIVEGFFDRWQQEKIAKLPAEWKSDRLPAVKTIRTGFNHHFIMRGKQWLTVKLQRSEFIHLNITGECLTAATIIRGRQFIRRKDDLMDGRRFEFSVLDAKPFEDIRLLLESEADCYITISTNPWWLVYGHRFFEGWSRDGHQMLVFTIMTATLLTVLEGEKRKILYDHLFDILVLFSSVTIYHGYHTLGTPFAGQIVGIGLTMITYFISSAVNSLSIQLFYTSVDYYRPFNTGNNFNFEVMHLLSLAFMCANTYISLLFTTCMFIVSNRIFLYPIWILPMLQLASKVGKIEWVDVGSQYEVGTQHAALFGLLAFEYIFERVEVLLKRSHLYILTGCVFVVQAYMVHSPLEYHYNFALFLLIVNKHTRNYTPSILSKDCIDLEALEREYQLKEKMD